MVCCTIGTMPRVSLSMIVKDEAETLSGVLADASAFCDELIVADTGSVDGTQDIAAAAGATVIDVPWTDDFAAARNASLDACTGDWVVWLDADDRIPPPTQQEFTRVLASLDDELDALITPYHYAFDAKTGQCTFTLTRERVLRRAAGLRWVGAVHEVVDVTAVRTREEPGLVVEHRRTDAQAERDTGRNLRILEKLYQHGDRSPRTLYYRANELRDNGHHEAAVAAYTEVLETQQPAWERYFALMSLAESQLALGRYPDALTAALRAVQLDPARPEAWMVTGRIHYEQEQWAQAVPFFSAASAARTRPFAGFVRDADYRWAAWDFLSVCLGNSGRHAEALDAGRLALSGNPDAERVRGNLTWFVNSLPH
jgi:tetratricopeptide (TPR) repeat protein